MPLGAARFGLSGADLGKLQLIETQTVSAVSSVSFTSIEQSTYNVHFFTFISETTATQTGFIRLRNSGGVISSNGDYATAQQFGTVSGTFGEAKNATTANRIAEFFEQNANGLGNGYLYLYNAGDSSKYTFATIHSMNNAGASDFRMAFGAGVRDTADEITGLEIVYSGGSNFSGTFSLYGIKES
jgi:hypothetical protein